jgi:ADP-ribosyl-[dinitrogen reductase] hydrolase
MELSRLLDKIRGCLVGVAVGDALGMPVETMTREEILQATDGKGVCGLIKPVQQRIRGTMDLKPGTTTDDTQLTFAVAQSLIQCRTFNIIDQANELIIELDHSDFGWGRSTKKSAQAVKEYLDSCGIGLSADKMPGRHPEIPAPPPAKPGDGCGNGVAMKVAPLAVFRALTGGLPEPFLSDVMALGLMTHGDPRASFTAAALGAAVAAVADRTRPLDKDSAMPLIRKAVTRTLKILEFRYQFFRDMPDDRVSKRFEALWESLDSERSLRLRIGNGCFALESVPFSIGVFLRHPADFQKGVLEAVNAGGDTDSTASMVGALIGANVGLSGIPIDWQAAVPSTTKAMELADLLEQAARG